MPSPDASTTLQPVLLLDQDERRAWLSLGRLITKLPTAWGTSSSRTPTSNARVDPGNSSWPKPPAI